MALRKNYISVIVPGDNTIPKAVYDGRTIGTSANTSKQGVKIKYNDQTSKPSRWERFKAFFRRGTKQLRPSAPEVVSVAAKRDFSDAEIQDIANDIFAIKGSNANSKMKILIKNVAVANVNQGLLSDLTTEINHMISGYENNAIEASDKSRAEITRNALQIIGYDKNILQRAIKQCADNTLIDARQVEDIIRPLFIIRGTAQRINWPVSLAELAKAVNPKNSTTFNCLVDIMATVNSTDSLIADPPDKKQLEKIVMQGLKETSARANDLLKYMSKECIESCAKIAAAYQGTDEQYNTQRLFIKQCADALGDRDPDARLILLRQCAEIANSRNTQGGRLAKDIVMAQGTGAVFDDLASITGFAAMAPNDKTRQKLFLDFLANNSVKGSKVLSLAANRDYRSAAKAIGLEITKRNISADELVGLLISQMPTEIKSDLLEQYCAISAATDFDSIDSNVWPTADQKLFIIQAALLNKINPEAIIKAMQAFSNDAAAGGKVSINSSQTMLQPVIKYLTEKYGQEVDTQVSAVSKWIDQNIHVPSSATRDLVVETLRFMEQGGYRAKNYPQAEQEAFDNTLNDLLKGGFFDSAGGEILQFMKTQGLDIARYINKNITKQPVLKQLLEKQNELRDSRLLTNDALGKIIAHDDLFAIQSMPDLIKNFTNQDVVTKELFEYLLFTPHQIEVFNEKMAAATAMLEKNPGIIDRSTIKFYTTMMLVAQDQAVISAAKKIIEKNARLLDTDLNKAFQDHAEEVAKATEKRPIVIRDAEKYADKAYQKNAAFVSEMNLKYKDSSIEALQERGSIFFSLQNSLPQELRKVIDSLRKDRVFGGGSITYVDDDLSDDNVSSMSVASRSNAGGSSTQTVGSEEDYSGVLPKGNPEISAVLQDITEYLGNAKSLLSHKTMPNKAYAMSADDLSKLEILKEQLKALDKKFTNITLGMGESKVDMIIKSAMFLLEDTVNKHRTSLSRENLMQIQNVLQLATSRVDQIYTLIYQPMEGFVRKSKEAVDSIIAAHINNREDAKNFMQGNIGNEMADNLERAQQIIADPQNKHIAYAAIHALQYLVSRIDDISSGKIKLTKQGIELIKQLTAKQLSETEQAAQNLEESISEDVNKFLTVITKDAYAKVGVKSSKSAETQFAIDINKNIAASVGAVVKNDMAAIKRSLQSLPKQLPSNSISVLHKTKEELSKIAKANAGMNDEVAQQAKQLKKEVDQIIGNASFDIAKEGNTDAKSAAQNAVLVMQALTKHVQISQQHQQLLSNLAAEAGKKVAELGELQDQISEAENYTKNKKVIQNIEQQLEGLQRVAAKIGGNNNFPASGTIIKLMNTVNNSMHEIGKSGNTEITNAALQTTKELSKIMLQIDQAASIFPLDFRLQNVNKDSVLQQAQGSSQKSELGLSSIPLPVLPDMTAIGLGTAQGEQHKNFQENLEHKRASGGRNVPRG